MGLRVDVILEQVHEDKPLIMHFHYMLNTVQFMEWLETHAYLCEGPLSFETKGIRVMIPAGADKWDKSGFSYDGEDGQKIFIPLLHQEATFRVHKDLFHQKEWVINYVDAPAAHSYRSNEG